MPQHCVQHGPQLKAVATRPAYLRLEQPPEIVLVEEPVLCQLRSIECRETSASEVGLAKPLLHGRAEPLLASIDQIVIDVWLRRLLQDPLADPVPQLVGRRQPRGEIDNVMVEKRDPRFHGMRHRELVDSHQQVLWKAELHLEIRDLLKDVRLTQMAVERAEVVFDDIVTVERGQRFGEQAVDRAIDRLHERVPAWRETIAHLAPPADSPAPEQLLSRLGAPLDFEIFAAETGCARLQRRQPPAPAVHAVSSRAVDRFVLLSIVLAP